MSHPYQYHNFVLREIPHTSAKTLILDAGSGLGIWGYLLRAVRRESVCPVGLDIAWPYFRFVQARGTYDNLIRGDLSRLPFSNRSFDFVLAVEVLEHLSKRRGRDLLNELSRCCRGKVILTTPNGFKPQAVAGVPSETHESGGTVRELKAAGFTVRGIGSRLVPLDYENLVLTSVFHYLGTPLAQVMPELGEWLIAVKAMDNRSAESSPWTPG